MWCTKVLDELIGKLLQFSPHSILLGAELEFYLRSSTGSVPSTQDLDKLSSHLGVAIKCERGLGQYEILVGPTNASRLLRDLLQLKRKLAGACKKTGLKLLLSAKPFIDDYGSALQFTISLNNHAGHNVGASTLPAIASAILDLLATDLSFICRKQDLSRLIPGWMAPSHLAWGYNNRTTVVRIRQGLLELRIGSANASPHRLLLLLLTAVLMAPKIRQLIPATYGNADHEQYGLPQLQFTNQPDLRRFSTPIVFSNFLKQTVGLEI